jgi:hypothetical protein
VSGVDRQVLLAAVRRRAERGLEQREGRPQVSTRAAQPAPLQLHPCSSGGARTGKRVRLVEQPVTLIEATPQTLNARQLGQDFSPSLATDLLVEHGTESLLRRLEIVEVPQRAEVISHAAHSR